MISRCFLNIVTEDLEATAAFYEDLFGFVPSFTSSWYRSLKAPKTPHLELGILRSSSNVVPEAARATAPALLTLVVEDVDAVFERAQSNKLNILQAPQDLF